MDMEETFLRREQQSMWGSAGTAARFLTAMLALSDGEYTIEASEQMKKKTNASAF